MLFRDSPACGFESRASRAFLSMSLIETIQQEVADTLSADPFFAVIPVLVESLGNVGSQVERALGPLASGGGRTGAVVVVTTPTANVNWAEVGGPFFDEIPIAVRVAVNPLTNSDPEAGTGASALSICEEVCGVLHQFLPMSANGPVVAQRPTITRVSRAGDDESTVEYLCHFKTLGGIQSALPQVATPAAECAAGQWLLACATPGAAIFYSVDGSNPSPRRGTLYTGPLVGGSGATIKARGWLAGYLASPTLTVAT